MGKAILVAGLAYGDEGKGATVDFLCRQLPVGLVVRYNGGSQAAHNVISPEGVHHTFSQFGSGMLADRCVRTHLSRFMLVDPITMMNEAEALGPKVRGASVWSRTTVDPRCVVITPFHKQLNRLREEARGNDRHGSCGMGVGVAREWQLRYGDAVLYAEDVLDSNKLVDKLRFLLDLACQEVGVVAMGYNEFNLHELAYAYSEWPVTLSKMPQSDLAVFEGAQGVLLDETHGVEPHRTWTDCTFANADALCGEAGITERFRIGCLRTYLTRHGHGPFASFELGGVPEEHNEENEWQGGFRTGPMNYELVRKALGHVGRVDCIALSHLDACVDGDTCTKRLEGALGVPVGIKAQGPTASHRQFTPEWTNAWHRMEKGAQV